MYKSFAKNTDKMVNDVKQTHDEIKKAVSSPIKQIVEVVDKTRGSMEQIRDNINKIPREKTITVKAKDEASAQLQDLRLAAQKTSDAYDHMKSVFANTGVTGVILTLKSGLDGAVAALKNVASIISAFDTVMNSLKQLRTHFSRTTASAKDLASAEAEIGSGGSGIGGGTVGKNKGAVGAGETVAKDSETVVKDGGTIAKDLSGSGRILGTLGKVGKAAEAGSAVLDVISSLSGLMGMTKKTIGSHVGDTIGSLGGTWGGAATGAAIGTLADPFTLGLGTPIGGAIGAAAGSFAGSAFGKAFGSWIQKNVEEIGKPIINTSINWGKSVGKNTQSALNQYVGFSDTAQRQLENIVVTGQKVSKQNVGSLVKPYQQMADDIIGHFNRTKSGAAKALAGLKTTNKSEYDAILKETTTSTNQKESNVRKIESQIESIYNNAAKNHRTLTASEQSQINKLQGKMNSYAVQSMSNSSKQQEIILGKLKDHAGSISAQQAASIVRNANKQEQGAISAANNEYKQVIKSANQKFNGVKNWADQQYYVNHSISRKQYDDIITTATQERDGVIGRAKQQHDQVVSKAQNMRDMTVYYAKQQAKGHADQVDWETGNVLSPWNDMVNTIKGWWQSIVNFFTGKGSSPVAYSHSTNTHGMAYAHGIGGHPGGRALVGDGVGSNAGPEAIFLPSGQLTFSPAQPTIVDLPAGTSVLSATATRELFGMVPHYAGGILSNVLNWLLQGPSKFINNSLNALGLGKMANAVPGQFGNVAWSMLDKTGSLAVNWAKRNMSNWIGGLLEIPGKVSGTLKNWIGEAMSIARIPASWASGLASIAMHESGGNPNSVNHWDSNAKAGHPSMGLMQMIGSTFSANVMPGFKNILNPIDSIIASYNYIRKRYGNIMNVPGIVSTSHGGRYVGYANGTPNVNGLLSHLNQPQIVIPSISGYGGLAGNSQNITQNDGGVTLHIDNYYDNTGKGPQQLGEELSFYTRRKKGLKS
ncbi:transglycosylase SLT domain-containing protein [Sporolactobacillus pectinivorans]|uniref:lytic transglycosylase domain-containing protein n=1 Tax=Sporolactobacillus pectinivorans TaxID=1591408 RepID=UPI0012FD977C|nr:transglycosylase SLT domain-containing protein [Sporolactobacillus pectinivorans]